MRGRPRRAYEVPNAPSGGSYPRGGTESKRGGRPRARRAHSERSAGGGGRYLAAGSVFGFLFLRTTSTS